jgi:ABC-2 type transport system permease protein
VRALFRLQVRRDRIRLVFGVLSVGLLWLLSAGAVSTEFADPNSRRALLSVVVISPPLIAVRGVPQGDGLAAFLFFSLFNFSAVVVGLINIFFATRHVRADEEAGRTELLGVAPLRRTSVLIVTALHGLLLNILMAAVVTLAQLASGFDARGSLLAGLATGTIGLTFLGLGLLAGQIVQTARMANAAGVALVLGAYLLRAIGDAAGTADLQLLTMTSAWQSWLSPIGWAQLVSPFLERRIWPFAMLIGSAALATAAAMIIQLRRDLGASLLPDRGGRSEARPYLNSPVALLFRLQRGSVLGWMIGAALYGLLAGTLSETVGTVISGDENVRRVVEALTPGGTTKIIDTFVVAVAGMAGVLATAAGCQAVLRLRGEETAGRLELLWVGRVSRQRWLLGIIAVGAASAACVALAMGITAGVAFLVTGAGFERFASSLAAGAAQIPAALFFVAVAGLLVVWLPRFAIPVTWTLLAVAYALGPIGALLGLDESIRELSPFQQTPAVPGDDPQFGGALAVLAVAVLCAAVATIGMRRRVLTA